MKLSEEFRVSEYRDYGPLEKKENIHLVRNKVTGEICVKKILESMQEEVKNFRKANSSEYFPKIFAVAEKNGKTIVIEEYIVGTNLEEYMMGQAIEEEKAVKIAVQICRALQCLHNYRPMIIYRDLKPENIMITPEEKIKLIDFDISRKYQEGKMRDTEILGTAGYAAPEQFGFLQTDNRTDIYAFGMVFQYMLAGEFSSQCIVHGNYEKVIRKCIAFDPVNRYQSMEELLEEFLTKESENGENKLKNFREWLPPGFRTKKIWKMLFSMVIYWCILWIGLSLKVEDAQGNPCGQMELWLNRLLFTLAQFVTIFLAFDYRGISEKIPFYKSRYKIIRIISFVVTWFLCMLFAAILLASLELLFSI